MIIDFPINPMVVKIGWGQQPIDVTFDGPFASQTAEISAPLWKSLLTPVKFSRADYADWEALLYRLKGRKNQLALWHLDRPQPRGTMRGVMVFNGAHAQGAGVLNISAAGQGGKTLLTGDHLGFGVSTTQQVVKVLSPATADVNGNITVEVESFLRNAFINGAAITWDKPKALFRRIASATNMEHARAGVDGLALDLIEDWNP
jgi:hypothetical protein